MSTEPYLGQEEVQGRRERPGEVQQLLGQWHGEETMLRAGPAGSGGRRTHRSQAFFIAARTRQVNTK